MVSRHEARLSYTTQTLGRFPARPSAIACRGDKHARLGATLAERSSVRRTRRSRRTEADRNNKLGNFNLLFAARTVHEHSRSYLLNGQTPDPQRGQLKTISMRSRDALALSLGGYALKIRGSPGWPDLLSRIGCSRGTGRAAVNG